MAFWKRIGQRLGDLVEDLSTDDKTRELFERGQAAFDAEDYLNAEIYLERVTREVEEHLRAWVLLGSVQLQRGKLVDARSSFERALLLRPEDGQTLTLLARAQRELGELDLALASAKRALGQKLDRELLAELAGLLGDIYLERGDAHRAVRELRKAVAFAGGEDRQLIGMLGLAHAMDGNALLAQHHLQAAATAADVAPHIVERLSEVLLELGRADDAALAAQRFLEQEGKSPTGHILMARAALAQGDQTTARQQLLFALELDRSSHLAHRLLGDIQRRAGNRSAAIEHLGAAQRQNPDDGSLARELVEALIEGYPTDLGKRGEYDAQLETASQQLLSLKSEDPVGLAAAALAAADDPNRAMQLAARGLAVAQTMHGQLALGALFEQGQQTAAAINAYTEALRIDPMAEVARSRLQSCLAQDLLPATDTGQTMGIVSRFHLSGKLFASHTSLTDLAAAVARIQRDFDRPLLVAVMGEFNTGKSTFVNALIGEELAPMGITPTTATINVLKYGEKQSARVLWQNDEEKLLGWGEVAPFLRELDNDQARAIRLVELLYPAEELLRVNVVDTPGLNSIVDEHEQTAREFLAQADAIVWLFSADQAGKQTEEQALAIIRQQKLKTVGVVNKIDRLAPAELDSVMEHLREGFAELVETIQPVSAKQALQAMRKQDQQALDHSRFPALRGFLDQQVFSRSRRIKREVAERRLRDIYQQAATQLQRERLSLQNTEDEITTLKHEFSRANKGWLACEQQRVRESLASLYRETAAEILEFVRPRSWMFGQNRAEQADQDFVSELLLDGLLQLATRSHQRLEQQLRRREKRWAERLVVIDQARPQLAARRSIESLFAQQQDLLAQQVYGQFNSFVRGLLAGGRTEQFFTEELPGMELTVAAIERILATDVPRLEAELMQTLDDWNEALQMAERDTMIRLGGELSLAMLRLDAGLIKPLLALEEQLPRAES